jgi:hypothetical protein
MFSTDPCVACAVTLAPGIGVDTRKRRPQGVIDPVGAAGKDCDQLVGARIGAAKIKPSAINMRRMFYIYCRSPLLVGVFL